MKSNGIWIDLILNIFSNNTVKHYDAQKLILIKYLNGCFLQANQHKITQLCYVNLILIHLFLPQLKINNVGVMFVFNFLLLCQRSHLITVRCSTIYCKQTKSMNKALLWHKNRPFRWTSGQYKFWPYVTQWMVIDLNNKHCTTLWRQRSMCSTGFGTKHYFTILLAILTEYLVSRPNLFI